jgi:succinate-acetate transporter protein
MSDTAVLREISNFLAVITFLLMAWGAFTLLMLDAILDELKKLTKEKGSSE